jgi:3-methylfumaryl-CoA hydratase
MALPGSRAMKLDAWIGRTETASDVVTATPYAGLSAVLDHASARPPVGTPLPPLWHWLYFLPLHKTSDIGSDGHARRGDFLPPVPLPRRMWAGSRFEFRMPLRVGDIVHRTSTIEEVAPKEGKSGPLVFVKVRHEVRRDAAQQVALVEWHDIVYRAAPRSGQIDSPARPAPERAMWTREWWADDVLLFRYSALTFNGHRIHYDRRYATEVEGYPGLVVHGPLLATLLLDLVRRKRPDAEIARYEFRAMRPIFDLHPFHVCGEPQSGGAALRLWVRDHEGALAMDATAHIDQGIARTRS